MEDPKHCFLPVEDPKHCFLPVEDPKHCFLPVEDPKHFFLEVEDPKHCILPVEDFHRRFLPRISIADFLSIALFLPVKDLHTRTFYPLQSISRHPSRTPYYPAR
jgi:hypothetical protein